MNKQTFFQYIKRSPFGNRMTPEQVSGIESIFQACQFVEDPRHTAYILATAFHETGGRMVPVREGFAKSDAAARKIVAKYKYGKPDPVTGQVYYGRGHVQLTWADNYKRMGDLVGEDLYHDPDKALDPLISAWVLVEGMMNGQSNKGDFTGKALENYFNGAINDPIGARRIVNGTDKAKLIATYYKAFLDALEASKENEQPEDVVKDQPVVDTPNLLKDKTLGGGLLTMGGIGGMNFLPGFDSINSVWAFAAFGLVALMVGAGLFLFLTGRLQIVKKGGV